MTPEITELIKTLSEKKYPKRSSVSSINRFMHFKKGLEFGIDIMKDWGRFYEENKFKLYITNPMSEEELLEQYIRQKLNP